MNNRPISVFDKTEEMNEVREAFDKVAKLCYLNKIPFVASFCYEADEEGCKYENIANMPGSMGCNLKKDYLSPTLLALNGFKVIPPSGLHENEKADLFNIYNDLNQ